MNNGGPCTIHGCRIGNGRSRRRVRGAHLAASRSRSNVLLDAFEILIPNLRNYLHGLIDLRKENQIAALLIMAASVPALGTAQSVQHAVSSRIISVAAGVRSLAFSANGKTVACYAVYANRSFAGPTLNSAVNYQVVSSSSSCRDQPYAVGYSVNFQPPSNKNMVFFRIDGAGRIAITEN